MKVSRALPLQIAILAALVSITVLGYQGWREWRARETQVRETQTSLANLASSLSRHAEGTFEVAEAVLEGLVERLEADGTSPAAIARLDRLLAAQVAQVPRVRDLLVFGEDGNMIASSLPTRAGNVADRAYFLHHREFADRKTFIGPPLISRGVGRWALTLTRRFQHPDGRFAGVVIAAIDLDYLMKEFATYDLGPNGAVLLMTSTGTILARYPLIDGLIGTQLGSAQLSGLLRGQKSGRYEGTSPLDGILRLGAYNQNDRFPLVSVAAMSADHALDAWRADTRRHLTIAGALAAIVSLLGWYLARQMWHRQAAERRVRESEARYRLLADNTTDVVTCLSLELKRTYVSPACLAVFGYTPSEMLDTNPSDFMHADDIEMAYDQVRPLVAGLAEQTTVTARLRHRQGHWVWLETTIALVRDPNTKEPAFLACSMRDISERHTHAAALETINAELERLAENLANARDQANQANQAKSRFLASMSHELRTPLNGILGYAHLLRRDSGLTPLQTTRVESMLSAGAHLLEMINQVLDLSDVETKHAELRLSEIDPREIARECLDLVRPSAEAKGLRLDLATVAETPRRITTDPTRLRQVLLNLLGNAIKFTTAGNVELQLRKSVCGLRFEVADTGPGIPAEHRDIIFQDFERLAADVDSGVEGAGLGLALSARLAGLLGGKLDHADNPGGGSIFGLTLPLGPIGASTNTDDVPAPIPHSTIEAGRAGTLGATRSMRVLVVDDQEMNRDITSAFLRDEGHMVVCAEDGMQAVATAGTSDFDVVLMDVRMPGINGLEATRRIRALHGPRGTVPVVALTAQAFAEQIEECSRAGMDSHLSKPFTPTALIDAVMRAVEVGQARTTPALLLQEA